MHIQTYIGPVIEITCQNLMPVKSQQFFDKKQNLISAKIFNSNSERLFLVNDYFLYTY